MMFIIDPLLEGLATERHQRLIHAADQWRLIKTVTRQQPSRRIHVLVTLAGWLIKGGQLLHTWGQRLHSRYQPATP
jgi:hypothetical protein